MLNNKEFVMFQIETYYLFSKLSICYYLIMNRDMEYAHIRALNIETILLCLKLLFVPFLFIYIMLLDILLKFLELNFLINVLFI